MRGFTPAVLPGLGARKVVVERRLRAGKLQLVLLLAIASYGDLGGERAVRVPTSGGEVDDPCQRVPPEHNRRSPDYLDPVEILVRQQVEIEFLRGRLVDPDAVEKHAQPLWGTGHGSALKPPQG